MKNFRIKNYCMKNLRIEQIIVLLFFWSMSSAFAEGPEIEYYGELTQGGVLVGKVAPSAELFLNDERIEVTKEGHFVFGFGRDASLNQTLIVADVEGRREERVLTLAKREYNVQRIEGVPQKTVTPPKEVLPRIKEETAQVKAARMQFHERTDFVSRFRPPSSGRITGVYGSQRVYNGTPKRPHFGVDYAGPVGEPVFAPASGIVTLVHQDMYYSGGTLIIDHGYGLSSTFIHLSEVLVAVGQEVQQGDVIAKIGQGGRSTGPHLDWRMNWKSERIDPQLMLKVELPEGF
jgi:murein DD-endopeptidase MepM/ murein hydrolase activator NlpD